jgi:uncharacterized membrane protein (DUF2068 family)
VRLLEAYGLFYEKAWAEVLAAGSGGLYLPAEIYELFTKPGWLRAGILVVNVAVVALMLHALIERRRLRSNPNLPASAS